MLGNKDLLAELFREKRFHSYLAGEIHIVNNKLTPNARRDGIKDSSIKDDLCNNLIRDIGIPYSKKIRELSRLRSLQKKMIGTNNIINKANSLISNGYLAESQKQTIIAKLDELKSTSGIDLDQSTILLNELSNSKHFIELNNGKIPKHLYKIYKHIFELIYQNMNSKPDAEYLINIICEDIVKSD